ncbi:MAG TPA: hypothetical protein VOB72_12285, partial [Candidatus Dormibacteraeota bacterium]|nr:hypothetical protein [Candidatus Dormibacteraeota bacterium]
AAPPSLAIAGLVPVLVVRNAVVAGQDPIQPAVTGAIVVAVLGLLAVTLMRAMKAFSEAP